MLHFSGGRQKRKTKKIQQVSRCILSLEVDFGCLGELFCLYMGGSCVLLLSTSAHVTCADYQQAIIGSKRPSHRPANMGRSGDSEDQSSRTDATLQRRTSQ